MMGASGTVQGKQAALSMPLGSIPFSDNRWYYRGPDGVVRAGGFASISVADDSIITRLSYCTEHESS